MKRTVSKKEKATTRAATGLLSKPIDRLWRRRRSPRPLNLQGTSQVVGDSDMWLVNVNSPLGGMWRHPVWLVHHARACQKVKGSASSRAAKKTRNGKKKTRSQPSREDGAARGEVAWRRLYLGLTGPTSKFDGPRDTERAWLQATAANWPNGTRKAHGQGKFKTRLFPCMDLSIRERLKMQAARSFRRSVSSMSSCLPSPPEAVPSTWAAKTFSNMYSRFRAWPLLFRRRPWIPPLLPLVPRHVRSSCTGGQIREMGHLQQYRHQSPVQQSRGSCWAGGDAGIQRNPTENAVPNTVQYFHRCSEQKKGEEECGSKRSQGHSNHSGPVQPAANKQERGAVCRVCTLNPMSWCNTIHQSDASGAELPKLDRHVEDMPSSLLGPLPLGPWQAKTARSSERWRSVVSCTYLGCCVTSFLFGGGVL